MKIRVRSQEKVTKKKARLNADSKTEGNVREEFNALSFILEDMSVRLTTSKVNVTILKLVHFVIPLEDVMVGKKMEIVLEGRSVGFGILK